MATGNETERQSRSEIVDGIHIGKVHGYGEANRRITIPKAICVSAKISNGQYMAVRQIGPCMVVTPLSSVDAEGAEAEFSAAFEKAMKAWEKGKR